MCMWTTEWSRLLVRVRQMYIEKNVHICVMYSMVRYPLGLGRLTVMRKRCAGLLSMIQSVNTFPHLHVQDKNLFFNSTKHISFNLDAEVFERDTDLNKKETLQELKNALFSSRELDAPFLTLFSSPVSAVTLPVQGRILASIPQEAEFFSFVHPCAVETLKARSDLANNAVQRMDQDSAIDVDMLVEDARAKYQKVVQKLDMNDPLVRFLVDGAFLYLDFKYDIVAINAVCLGDYSYLSSGNAGPGPSIVTTDCSIYFGEPSVLPRASTEMLERLGRWWPVTAQHLIDMNVTHFAWILPSETLGTHIFTRGGGFGYKSSNENGTIFFPVVSQDCDEKVEPVFYDGPSSMTTLVSIEGLASSAKGGGPCSQSFRRMTGYMDHSDILRLREHLSTAVRRIKQLNDLDHRAHWAQFDRVADALKRCGSDYLSVSGYWKRCKEILADSPTAHLIELEDAILDFPDSGECKYVRRCHDALGLKSVRFQREGANSSGFSFLTILDKYELSNSAHTGSLIFFNLDARVFETKTRFNSAEALQQFRDRIFGASGLHWVSAGTERPKQGREIVNEQLAQALQNSVLGLCWEKLSVKPQTGEQITNDVLAQALLTQRVFSIQELSAFNLDALSPTSYIVVDSQDYKPVAQKKSFDKMEWMKFGIDAVRLQDFVKSGTNYFKPAEVRSDGGLTLFSSPLNSVTLPDQARLKAAIPEQAAFVSFCYPCAQETLQVRAELAGSLADGAALLPEDLNAKVERAVESLYNNYKETKVKKLQPDMKLGSYRRASQRDAMVNDAAVDEEDPLVRWLTEGAFFYFDFKFNIVAINAIYITDAVGKKDADKDFTFALHFGQPSELSIECIAHLKTLGRWWPVTSKPVLDQGFSLFSWILPVYLSACSCLGFFVE
jgi:hypothetical protein